METKTHTLGPASCRVRQTAAVPVSLRESTRELAALTVLACQRNKGFATSLVHKVCREADRAGIVLMLWPKPWGDSAGLSQSQLIDWYGREFGFVQIQPEPPLMARQPGAKGRRFAETAVAIAAEQGARA
jgi:hypothetical protein